MGKKEQDYKKSLSIGFIEYDICRKELPLLRNTSDTSALLVISFLEKKDGDAKDNLCTFCIDEKKIDPKLMETEERLPGSIQETETVGPESVLPGRSDTPGHEIVPYAAHGRELSLPQISAEAKAQLQEQVKELSLYKTSMKDPPADLVKECRNECQQLIGVQRQLWIEEVRKHVPSGTTGPLEEENKPYEQLDAKKKQQLTKALCGQDVLRRLVDEFGQSGSFDYYDRQKNPVEVLFEEEIKKQSLTVGEMYDIVVKCEANAVADKYL